MRGTLWRGRGMQPWVYFGILLLVIACARAQPMAPHTEQVSESGARVIFPDGFVVRVEIAADEELRAQGLMYRDSLRPGTGMLFFFPEDGEHSFWMRNTRIPLDMIWIDADRRIVHIKHDVPPCHIRDCPSYAPGVDSRYVLEVAAGVAREHGLEVGDVLRFEGTEGVRVR
jgi:uncharacterized protein